ncbi:MAG: DUF3833 family protein [Alphaproteobacteria bacterium]
MFSRRAALALLPLGLTGCLSPTVDASLGAKPLVLEEAFRGHFLAEGRFVSRIGNPTRTLKVVMNGTWNGRVLTLVEDFTYSDGEKDRLTWRFTKLGPGRYSGTREDVIGPADVRQEGNVLRLSYDADVKVSGGKQRVRFEDVIYLRADGSMLNIAVVSAYGVPVGDVELIIRRAR